MEKAFEDVLSGAGNTATEPTSTLGPEYDLDLSDLDTEVEEPQADDGQGEATDPTPPVDNPTNTAFAQMRVRNKQLEGVYSDLDEIAKSVGLAGAEEFITKAKAQKEAKDAQAKGIPVEIAKELQELSNKIKSMEAEKVNEQRQAKERELAGTLQSFIKDNGLTENDVNVLGNTLDRDGLSMDVLMNMSPSAQKKIFKAYYGKDNSNQTQKQLERKNAIKNELPISQTNKAPIDLNKQIDDLAKQMAGRL